MNDEFCNADIVQNAEAYVLKHTKPHRFLRRMQRP